MSNEFWGTGNIGQAPELRNVLVGNESRAVVDLRVYFDRNIRQPDDTFEDVGGFWLTVVLWGTQAERAIKLLQKGMRIDVNGSLRLESWQDNAGEERSEFRLTADHFSINPLCLESVVVRKRNGQAASAEHEGALPNPMPPGNFEPAPAP